MQRRQHTCVWVKRWGLHRCVGSLVSLLCEAGGDLSMSIHLHWHGIWMHMQSKELKGIMPNIAGIFTCTLSTGKQLWWLLNSCTSIYLLDTTFG